MLNETMYRIALQYLPRYGNVLIRKMLDECGTAEAVFQDSSDIIRKLRRYNRFLEKPQITPEILSLVEREVEWMDKHHVELCFLKDAHYPWRLKSCTDAPVMFYYKGNRDFNHSKVIAVVGTRFASTYGKNLVRKLVSELAPYNISIVSGLAEGIDTEAHEQALTHELNTVAVLGSGLGVVYPSSNQGLFSDIVEKGGSVVSEYSFRAQPDRQNFPKRNRIIAGLADATIVVETAQKGGSMITAHIASSYNRDVFAFPGSVFTKSYEGCHQLINRNIASILTSGEDLVRMMGWNEALPKSVQRDLFVELSKEEQVLVDFIKQHEDVSIDQISVFCGDQPLSKRAGLLLGLELKGVLECCPGKRYRII